MEYHLIPNTVNYYVENIEKNTAVVKPDAGTDMWIICQSPNKEIQNFQTSEQYLQPNIKFTIKTEENKSYPCNRPWRPIRLLDVEAPTFSRKLAHRWQWDCQPQAPAALYTQEDSWYSFLLEAESTPGP
jgi:hypothetical protein